MHYERIGGGLANTVLGFYWVGQESLSVGGIRTLWTVDIKGQRERKGEESGFQRWILREE